MSTQPGLLFVASRIKDTTKTSDEQFNRMYDEEHLPDVLNYKHKVSDLALRYRNTNAESERPYLALYPLEDVGFFASGTLEKFTEDTHRSRTFGGEDILNFVHFEPRPYEKIQTFTGYAGTDGSDGKGRARTLTCVAMEPAEGEDEDFDEWYRKQHLDILSMCRGYRRTTRYKRIDGVKPRYLALHEWSFAPADMPVEQIKQVASTEWSKKVVGSATVFERDVFELIQAQGDLEKEL